MIDDDELLKEFDDLIITDKNKCGFCQIALTDENISEYKSFFKVDGRPVLVSQCTLCQEILDRLYLAHKNKIITTEKQVRSDIIKEGWTPESLKAYQEK